MSQKQNESINEGETGEFVKEILCMCTSSGIIPIFLTKISRVEVAF